MTDDRSNTNSDLRVHEPLRIAFAIGALLLGLAASMHPDAGATKPAAADSAATSTQP